MYNIIKKFSDKMIDLSLIIMMLLFIIVAPLLILPKWMIIVVELIAIIIECHLIYWYKKEWEIKIFNRFDKYTYRLVNMKLILTLLILTIVTPLLSVPLCDDDIHKSVM